MARETGDGNNDIQKLKLLIFKNPSGNYVPKASLREMMNDE
jgi:hypothetical protein